MSDGILLDTCAAVWWAEAAPIASGARLAIDRAAGFAAVHVSPITAWELQLIQFQGRKPAIASVETWYGELLKLDGFLELPLTAHILIAAWTLPGAVHKDPADRILIASARVHNLTLITRDRAMIAYGAAGHVNVMAC